LSRKARATSRGAPLVRREELSIEDAHDLLTEPIDGGTSYADRFDPPWDDHNIRHELLDARDHFRGQRETVDEVERFRACMERAGAAAAEHKRATVVEARTAALVHVPTFDPLKERTPMPDVDADGRRAKPRKPTMSDLLFDLDSRDEWTGVFRYNEFDDRIYAFRPPFRMSAERGSAHLPDEDVTGMRAWFLVKVYTDPDKTDLASAARFVAKQNPYHPVRDWLSGLAPAGSRHLDNLASVLFGDERPIAQVYVRRALIAACARAMRPGCQVDTVLTLIGPQGAEKKSTTVRELFRVPGCNTFRDDLPDIRDSLKMGQALEGVWVAELAELDAIRKADIETVKAVITRCVERYSPKYVAGEVTRPRGCVFWASTNTEEFLPGADPAFRRRFWPVRMNKRADMSWLETHREEIWAEAMALYTSGEAWWFEDERQADEGRAEFVGEDSWAAHVSTFLAHLALPQDGSTERFVTTSEIYAAIVNDANMPPSDADTKKVRGVMAGLGYTPSQRRVNKANARGYVVHVTAKATAPELGNLLRLPLSQRNAG
jgi:predicted P-loop ATPase